jgi:addiction module HigA family antidote
MPKTLPPVHPGEMIREEFMRPLGISINMLARELHIPTSRVSQIVNEQRGISADTAMRAARYFGTTPEFWQNLQSRYDLLSARDREEIIRKQVHPLTA